MFEGHKRHFVKRCCQLGVESTLSLGLRVVQTEGLSALEPADLQGNS